MDTANNQNANRPDEHMINLGRVSQLSDEQKKEIAAIAKAAAELRLFISTRGEGPLNPSYKEFRRLYKEQQGPYSSVYLPADHRPISGKEEYADSVVYDGSDAQLRDLIMLSNAKTLIAVSGDFIGSDVADVLQAINTYQIPVIIYDSGGENKLLNDIKRISSRTLNSELLYPTSGVQNFKDTVATLQNIGERRARKRSALSRLGL